MATLSVGIIGLNRVSASIGLALHRYMAKGGRYKFEIVGHDPNSDNEKKALKMGATDRNERRLFQAAAGRDIVVLALSYDEVQDAYRGLAQDLRDGVVVLDLSPLKRPSLDWADTHLGDEHHMVGITPILNPRHLFDSTMDVEQAEEDLFDDSAILLTPSVSCIKEAVDLAFNFCQLLGSKPRFLDPLEHDMLLAQTEQLPALLGTLLFHNLHQRDNWDDLQWLTNPVFGALTRPLFDRHPDGLRDEWLANREVLLRTLDSYMATLAEFRALLQDNDDKSVEAFVVEAARQYEVWINRRFRADWDAGTKPPDVKGGTMMQSLLGDRLSKRLFGGDKDEDDEQK